MIRRSLAVAPVLAALAALAVVGAPRAAYADMPAGAGTLSFDLRFSSKDNPDSFAVINPDQVFFHLNRATCLCAESFPANPLYQLGVYQKLTGVTTPLHSAMSVYVASSTTCDDTAIGTNHSCINTDITVADFNAISVNGFFLAQIPAHQFIEPGLTGCTPATGTHSVYDIVKTDATYSMGNAPFDFDTQAPPPVTGFTAVGGENAIQIGFDPPVAGSTDVLWYQALCAKVDGTQALDTPTDAPKYFTSRDVCGLEQEVALQASPVEVAGFDARPIDAAPLPDGTPDAFVADAGTAPRSDAQLPPANLPTSLSDLDPAFICGTTSGTGTGMRITGLENYQQYRVVFLAIDKYGNASGTYLTDAIEPRPVTDFWEDTHDEGSDVQSGFCLISDTYGDGGPITQAMRGFRDGNLGSTSLGRAFTRFYYAHVAWLGEYARGFLPLRIVLAIVLMPFVLIALAWHVLTLPGLLAVIAGIWLLRRRRRSRHARLALAASAALAVFGMASHAAYAQSDDAYWNTDDTGADDALTPVEPTWIFGIKLGPYVPAIDAQFQNQTGLVDYRPYHHMFGGYNIMPVLEFDRVVFRSYGQVTVGGSIGFLGKSAHAYLDGSTYTDPNRPTSAGDTNTFRMIPLSLQGGYRLTVLDDLYGIPIIPYVKGGLAYDVWWMRNPNGGFSYVGDDNCHPVAKPPMTCTTARESAVGGSAGLIGSIGIAIRAERIDADAASSMRGGGVEHAGFYAELQASWVDSFGDKTRLSLGDKTWFAGFDFEF